ncbi:MAG: antibiotic biosynthesis monooxygenase [bacterium]|nr:antibiotic biosynthesis monooxygenase [bacterium]
MSVLEIAHVDVLPGHDADFEADLLQAAATVLPRAAGFIEFTGHGWGVERPSIYLFSIRWETLADHVEGFRAGELFVEWRALIGGHFAAPPVVEHFAHGEHD